MANAAASRAPIAAPNATTTKAISPVARTLGLSNSAPCSSTADGACMRTPAMLITCPTIGSAPIRANAKATSPPTAPASAPRAINRVFTAEPIRHTYAILHRTLLDRSLLDRMRTERVRWGHDQGSRYGARSARTGAPGVFRAGHHQPRGARGVPAAAGAARADPSAIPGDADAVGQRESRRRTAHGQGHRGVIADGFGHPRR